MLFFWSKIEFAWTLIILVQLFIHQAPFANNAANKATRQYICRPSHDKI